MKPQLADAKLTRVITIVITTTRTGAQTLIKIITTVEVIPKIGITIITINTLNTNKEVQNSEGITLLEQVLKTLVIIQIIIIVIVIVLITIIIAIMHKQG